MSNAFNTGLRYRDKVTIVTGGSRGIGKAIVNVFAHHGSKVVIAALNEERGSEVAREVTSRGSGEAIFVKCDVTKEEDVKMMVNETVKAYGKIDCVINNAGTSIIGRMENYDIQDVRFLNDLNILGPFIVAKYSLPYLRKTKGNIINIGSISGIIGQKAGVAYAATKAASIGFTKSLAVEEAPNGVRINGVVPGATRTELFDEAMLAFKTDEAREFYSHKISVMGRMALPEEIAMACLYFAADATYCTGSIQICSGGTELGYGVKSGIDHYFELKDS